MYSPRRTEREIEELEKKKMANVDTNTFFYERTNMLIASIPFSWNKWYHRYNKVCLISWLIPRNWQWESVNYLAFLQRRWFQCSNVKIAFYMSAAHEYVVYISHLVQYSIVSGSYHVF